MRITQFSVLAVALLLLTACAKVRNAADFGFLPDNSPEENTSAFQNCLDGGGKIVVDKPGVYRVSGTLFLDSDTDLRFGEGVVLQRARNDAGVAATHVLLNRGALTRTYDENISVRGLRLQCAGIDAGSDIPEIVGLRGHLAFFYIRNLLIDDFELLDLESRNFAIQICTFDNVTVSNLRVEGRKDAVHFGPGKHFRVSHGMFRTYDDPIALNAQDYTTGNPEMGWIEDGLIEDCHDLEDPERGTTGFFARIIAGAWCEWRPGMEIQSSGDAVVSCGRIYRSKGPVEEKTFLSECQPTHESGTVTYPDGITWTMSQDRNVCCTCGVRDVVFRDIHLQKRRPIALSLHFDHDKYSRSYYPGAEVPVQDNIVFERVFVEADIPVLLQARTPVGCFTVRDSDIASSRIRLATLDTPGMVYDTTCVVLSGVRSTCPDSLILPTVRPYKLSIE